MSAPETTLTDLRVLETILGTTGGWMLARVIAQHPLWLEAHQRREGQSAATYVAAAERLIRAVANAGAGSIVSYPGSPGYKLRICATPAEVQTAIAKLRHQSAEMHARATAIERFGQKTGQLELVVAD